MADDTDQTTQDTGMQAEPHGDATETTQTEATQPDTDWKAQARKWEKLAKANYEKAEQADQLRERAEKADELQKQLDELNAAKAWDETVAQVSKDTGTPEDVLRLLKADTADTLTEAAHGVDGE